MATLTATQIANKTGIYQWDYETILDQIPGLKGYQEPDQRLRKINKKMAASIAKLLNSIKREVSVKFGKKKNFFDMKQEEISRLSLDKLIDYYHILGKSIIEMVRKGKLNKM